MKPRKVAFSEDAKRDLSDLYDWIASATGPAVADRYLDRLGAYCRGFELASERGTQRDDIRPGLRIVGFERRITIAFTVEEERVVILRLYYGGRDWPSELQE